MSYRVTYCTCSKMPVEHFNVISTDIPNDTGVCCTTRFKNGRGFDMRRCSKKTPAVALSPTAVRLLSAACSAAANPLRVIR